MWQITGTLIGWSILLMCMAAGAYYAWSSAGVLAGLGGAVVGYIAGMLLSGLLAAAVDFLARVILKP